MGCVDCQAPLSMWFPRQECWRGLPFPSPGDLPDPRIEPRSLALLADSSLTELPGNWKGPQTTWVPRLEEMDVPLFAPLGLGSTKSFNFCSKGVFISKFWPCPNDKKKFRLSLVLKPYSLRCFIKYSKTYWQEIQSGKKVLFSFPWIFVLLIFWLILLYLF